MSTKHIEAHWFHLTMPNSRNIYICNTYRPPTGKKNLSSLANITQGVPQGSILGPLLYIIYANDIQDIITKSKFAYYTDDTVILSGHKNLEKAFSNVQKDLNNLLTWCTRNRIHINATKTKYMVFPGKKNTDPISSEGQPLN